MPLIVNTEAGIVRQIFGHAVRREADGSETVLKVGDLVQAGDQLLTAQDSIVEITGGEAAGAGTELDRVIEAVDTGELDADPRAGLVGGAGGALQPGLRVGRIVETLADAEALPADAAVATDGVAFIETSTAPELERSPNPLPIITLGPIAGDDVLSDAEAATSVGLTGSVGGGAQAGDTVQVTVGAQVFNATVQPDLSFSVQVPGSLLAAAPTLSVTASVVSSDGLGGNASGQASRAYTLNRSPTAVDDAAALGEDTPSFSGQLNPGTPGQDSDPDGDVLAVAAVGAGSVPPAGGVGTAVAGVWGSLLVQADGSYTYTPAAVAQTLAEGQAVDDVFSYRIVDSVGQSASATLTVTLTGSDDAPLISAGSGAVVEDLQPGASGTLSASDIDNPGLAFVPGTQSGRWGELTLDGDGRWQYQLGPAAQALDGGDVETERFTVTLNDGSTTTVEIQVSGSADPLLLDLDADDSSGATGADYLGRYQAGAGPVAIVDADLRISDVDTTLLQGATVRLLNGADGDLLSATGLPPGISASVDGGLLTLSGSASLADYESALRGLRFDAGADVVDTTSRRFEIVLETGDASSNVAVATLLIDANRSPIAADTAIVTDEDTPISGNLPVASDADGDPISYAKASEASHGTVVVNADGSYSYTPNGDYHGPDSFSYTVADGQGGSNTYTVDIEVRPINDAPIAADAAIVTDEDTPISGNLPVASDADGDAISYAKASEASHGTVVVNADGSYSYTPNGDYHGSDSFSYTVDDGQGGSNTYTVDIEVRPINDAPIAADAAIVTDEDTAISGSLPVASDADGDPISYAKASEASHGMVVVNADGSYSYTPNGDYHGSDSFSYTVDDGQGGSNTYTVDIEVRPINDAPIAADAAIVTDEDTAISGNLPVASDADGDPVSYAKASEASHGTVVVNADGSYSYTPNGDYHGSDSFTYTVADGQGGSNTYTVDIEVRPINDAPIAADAAIVTDEDTAISGSLPVASDADGDPVSYAKASEASHGMVVVNADGSYSYTPNGDYHGSDSFTYTVDDGQGGSNTYTVDIEVRPINDAPIAADTAIVTDEDTPISGNLPVASDADGDPVSYAKASEASHGTVVVNADGSYSYTPNGDYHGSDSFSYTVDDGQGGSNTYTVDIEVRPINDAPIAADAAIVTDEDTAISGNLPVASDADGDPVSYAKASEASHGTVVVNADGSYSYTPNGDYHGSDSFTYTVADGQGGSNTYTVDIEVRPINDAPIAADAAIVTDEDTAISGNLPVASDADGDPVSYAKASEASHGTVVVNADGSYSYTPNGDYHGSDSFTYTVADGQGGSNTYTVDIEVRPINDAPIAADAAIVTDEDTAISGSLPVASDADGDAISYAKASEASHGTVVVNADGSYSYTPNGDYHGPDSFTYTVADGQGGSNTYTVDIEVRPINDAPVIVVDGGVAVSEEGLAGALPDDTGSDDTTNAVSASGQVTVGDADGDSVALTLSAPLEALQSRGEAVVWEGAGTQTLVGRAGARDVGTLTVGDDGSYTFRLHDVVDHPAPGLEDQLSLSFGLHADDGVASRSGVLTVRIEDDAPPVNPEATEASLPLQDTNLVIVLDVSASMTNPSGFGGTRLDSARQAIDRLFDLYEQSGNLAVRLITFNSTAQALGDVWTTVDEARAQLATIDTKLGTNFDAALARTQEAFVSDGKIDGALNALYFLSDGKPRPRSTGIGDAEEAAWKQFLDVQQIKSFAVGVGAESTPEALNPVAYDGHTSENTDALIVTDLSQLDDTLVSTAPGAITGTLLPGGRFDLPTSSLGADGGRVLALSFGATTYAYDADGDGSITVTGGPDRSVYDSTTRTLTVDTELGGEFSVELETGSYRYAAPAQTAQDAVDGFDFVAVDGDGDTVASSVSINLVHVLGRTGSDGGDSLLGTAFVDRISGLGGDDTIDGGDGADTLIGNAGDDLLSGEAGADHLFGGAGSDTLQGGDGADLLDGGQGNDELQGGLGSDVFAWTLYDRGDPGLPAIDTVKDFSAVQRAQGGDVLDLRDLLVGESTGTLDEFLDFNFDGLHTELRISHDGGFAGGVYSAGTEDQRVVLENLDIRAELGLADDAPDAAIIQGLLDRANLLVDAGP